MLGARRDKIYVRDNETRLSEDCKNEVPKSSKGDGASEIISDSRYGLSSNVVVKAMKYSKSSVYDACTCAKKVAKTRPPQEQKQTGEEWQAQRQIKTPGFFELPISCVAEQLHAVQVLHA